VSVEDVAPIELRRAGSGRILWRCLGYLRPYWAYVAASYVLLLVTNGITLAMPIIMRQIVDRGIRGGEIETIQWGV
jgi:ATP-binding cassette subfamily B protein